MNQNELNEILAAHEKWLKGEEGGERAELRWADLTGADLTGAELRWAFLRGADLRDADLSEADLRGAKLTGARGFVMLPVQDPRGHSFPHAVQTDDGWLVVSGCKRLSIADARAYVSGETFSGEPWLRDAYLHAFDWLEAWINCPLTGGAA